MTKNRMSSAAKDKPKSHSVKCVVWDLDDTIWEGTLLEDDGVALRAGIGEVIEILDERGILNSIASKNDESAAVAKLSEFGLSEYFLHPQINWNSKVASIRRIADSLNIGLDSIAFVDDQPFERDEVSFSIPEILCIDATDMLTIPDLPEMNPRFVTEDSKRRRSMYLSEMTRAQVEKEFVGTEEEFLASLGMRLMISFALKRDLERAEELTIRTHQLNTTGYAYSYESLDRLRQSPSHKLLLAELDDRYGTYGKIGLALLECNESIWTIKLLLMSCRVMSRGIGTIMINHILKLAKDAGVRLQAEFVPTERNRMMYITYKFAGFQEIRRQGDMILLENDLTCIQAFPHYVDIQIVA